MRSLLLFTTLFVTWQVSAQVQLDKPIQFTGSGADAKVTGIADVSGTSDAVSAGVLQRNSLTYASTIGGTVNAIQLTYAPALAALQTGMILTFRANGDNTAAVTVDVDAGGPLAAVPVRKAVSSELAAGDIKNGQMVSIIYDGTVFQLLAGAAAGGSAPRCLNTPSPTPPNGYAYTGYFQNYTAGSTGQFWTARQTVPVPKVSPAVTVYNNRLYLFGGNSSNSVDRPLSYFYDPVANTWSAIASMPAARWENTADMVNNKIYVVGGQIGSTCDAAVTYEYDPVTNTWATRAAPGATIRQSASAVWNNMIYYFGSGGNCCSPCPVNTVWRYNPAGNSWTTLANMPITRLGATAQMINNRIYIAGGFTDTGGSTTTARVHEYDPNANSFVEEAPMPTARQRHSSAVLNGLMYCLGGSGSAANEAYDPATNVWEIRTNMTSARENFGAAQIGGFIYVVSGGTGSSGSQTNERYNPTGDTGYRFYMHCQP